MTRLSWRPSQFLDRRRKQRPKSHLRETVETFAFALVVALGIRATIAEARFIPSESMLPTLLVGDRLIVEKVSYRLSPPRAGDIVVFTPPDEASLAAHHDLGNNAFIKRVIGVAGDRLAVDDGVVYRNGKPLSEPYIREEPVYRLPDPDNPVAYFHEGSDILIPAGHVFVMGDNRNNSLDSHVWGFLPVDKIIGRAVVRFWPPDRLGWPG
ncbi:MAG: signal peptidase I [bacterium]|nr:signal peptidase I [bacterium]